MFSFQNQKRANKSRVSIWHQLLSLVRTKCLDVAFIYLPTFHTSDKSSASISAASLQNFGIHLFATIFIGFLGQINSSLIYPAEFLVHCYNGRFCITLRRLHPHLAQGVHIYAFSSFLLPIPVDVLPLNCHKIILKQTPLFHSPQTIK